MDTTCIRFALGPILLHLLLLSLPNLSIAEFIYSPHEIFSINCGSNSSLSTRDGRNWTADIKFLSENKDSVAAPALTPSTLEGPYTDARFSHSQFTYSFPVSTGPKFLRLFFYSTSYRNFDRSKAYFSVKAGPYTLLQDFNASLHADADDDPENTLLREYCINLRDGERLNISFIASTEDSYAFINGIEIVSMPPFLYYTNPDDDITGLPQPVGLNTNPFPIENNYAMETKYRLRVGDQQIPALNDTGMLRSWDVDNKYVTTQSVLSLDIGTGIKLRFTKKTPNYTAPDTVYRSVRNMGSNGTFNMGFNLTWQLPVDSGFTYLLRLHFCQLDPNISRPGDQSFFIYVQDQLVEDWADIIGWSHKQKGVPVVKQYVVLIPGNEQETLNLSLKMHPNPKSLAKDAQINAIELFKINDPTGNLAGPNPDSHPKTSEVLLPSSNKKSKGSTRTLTAAVAGTFSGVVMLSLSVAFLLTKTQEEHGRRRRFQ
ncbi:hypothetical protein JHK87_051459 [Glycine soja]|nr:hypothetical protein JHK87_051459 [Glycine soja]